ncbi:RsmB/NOP family class I SAM-dependent RNA methyltransferase [Govanella unica]|uniref:RsmB/NOP family class I SAM-dependent RNA methyltransferase n=1 Tax=Govanella unica TaxID=2975056 RepID=A0A9X3TYJ1_9PROT|nr:RsmB/NOP family class I SAM-dependent RNA methyltransferase [Govania unica]MDA5194315.1 RsmB/NOP family class I SAM-dependent RNA methyltransferase [Govania unica]
MIPAARTQAVIEIISDIEAALRDNGAAADVILRQAFAARRYAGSKDRAAISDGVYAILRSRGALVWLLEAAQAVVTGRHLMIAHLARTADTDFAAIFTGQGHAPLPLDDEETALAAQIPALGPIPEAIALECPAWLEEPLRQRFGESFAAELTALQGRAPLTLRVNSLRTNVEATLKALAAENITATRGRYLPDSILVEGAPRLDTLSLIRDGWVEVQDEASQIGVRLVDARPKLQVADLCAGAGGKTLALAAAMKNTGQVHAFDTDSRRLGNLRDRMRRADARNIQAHQLPMGGEGRATQLKPLLGGMDRVVLDVPCSGSGTWRRSPELRWRLTPERLDELTRVQDALLDEGASLVKPGGHLVYMTCSLLAAENDDRIAAFLSRRPDFLLLDYRSIWGEGLEQKDNALKTLSLSPGQNGTDGFFVAVLAVLAK